ncbi:MAG: hypothetical protein Q7V31_02070 [Parvibaculum sp.]|uniref:hypothetical protein n=1 Tax=Parvibaculum sp. TaxID=2024848 RepID=UPI002716DB37|nr:hypothetical protein [Parvibaculum sp.]MDO8837686.1 hypothetical protein [Parvibaculum sp.]
MIKGYVAACAAAIATTSILTVIVIANMESGSQLVDAIKAVLLGTPAGFAFLLIAALPGAVAIVAVARIGGFSSWGYYAAGGASSALLAVIGIAVNSGVGDLHVTNMSTYISLFPAALMGGVAGLTYWRVAVRERRAEGRPPPEPKGWGSS